MRLVVPIFLMLFLAFTACRKSEEITTDKDVKLSFSSDTVLFDTVFTAIGSTNKRVKIYNKDKNAVNISNIKLSGGAYSYFSLIINGQPVNEKTDLKVGGKDSISIFIKVTINPDNQSQPFIVQDSILFSTNGNHQAVALIAYGQNAVFINNLQINANTNWTSTLPYIIYKNVSIAPNVTLSINPGTKVLFHSDASMSVKGSLNVEGTKTNPVLFTGDRLESYYAEEPGQWKGIHFYGSSSNSKINYAMLKNAIIGITTDSLSASLAPKLTINSSSFRNMTVAAFAGYNAEVNVFNSLFSNCGQYLLYGVGGGKYNLKQNTFAGYNPAFARKGPAIYLSDYNSAGVYASLKVDMANNIVWGQLAEEFLIDKKTSAVVEADIRNNLLKTLLTTYNNKFNILNIDPGFVNAGREDFGLQPGSPALSKGADLSTESYYNSYLYKSMNNMIRSASPDLGCYEK